MNSEFEGCLPELRNRGLLPGDQVSVFLGGSLVRGWGNEASDLDVYVISGSPRLDPSTGVAPVALTPDFVPIEVIYVNGRRWDIEYWTVGQVEQLLAKVSWTEFDAGRTGADMLASHERDFVERLHHSLPLSGPQWLEETRGLLGGSAIRQIFVTRALNFADIFVEDAVGQLKGGDRESAVLSAKLAFNSAIYALHCAHGELGQSSKWAARRFRHIDQQVVPFEEYWAIETMRDFDADDPAAWIESVVLLCRRISLEVVI